MFVIEKDGGEEVDQEWKELIVEAKKLGITLEEIREFFTRASTKSAAQR